MHRISNCIVSKSQTSNSNQTKENPSYHFQSKAKSATYCQKYKKSTQAVKEGFGKDIKEKTKHKSWIKMQRSGMQAS